MAAGYDGSVKIDTKLDSKGFNEGIKGIMGSLKNVAAAVGIAFGIGAIVAFGKSAVDTASQMSNALTGLKSVLDAQGRSFSDAQSFIQKYTADGLIPATNAIATYKNLATRGFSTAEIEKLMLVMKDSAAFNRQSAFTMGEAVQKASEGLRNENSLLTDSVGIQTNVAKMWEKYAKSIGKSAQDLTLAEKRQAEYNGFLEEAKYFSGDAAKAAGTYSGKIAALSTTFTNLKVAIGNTIIPIVNALLPPIKTALDWLTTLFTTFSQYVQAFFGYDPSATMGATAEATNAAADAQGNLANQTEEANKAAKGSLATFDELNVLQKKETETPAEAPAAAQTAANQQTGGISAEIQAQVDEFKKKLEDLTSGPLAVLSSILETLKPLGVWLWDNFLKPAGEWTAQAFKDTLNWLNDRLKELAKWIRDNPVAFQNIAIIIGILAVAFLAAAAAAGVATTFTGIWTAVSGVATAVTTAFGAAVAFLTSPVFLVVAAIVILIGIVILLIKNWDWVKETAAKVWAWIVETWGKAGTWFTTNVTDPVKNAFKTALDWVDDKWHKIWSGITGFVKNSVNSIIDFINGMIRAVADGINSVIGSLNNIHVQIPDWVPIFGGQSWGMNLPLVTAPQIPRLATGAVIPPNAEFAAILGDQRSGRNLEAPEGLIRQIIREEIGQVNANVSISFNGSMGELVRVLKPYIDRENVRVGGNLIRGGASA